MSEFARAEFPRPVDGLSWVYILQSLDGGFYIGSARDVSRRTHQHQAGRGAKFTQDHGVSKLVYVEGPFDLKVAIQREFQLKRWSRAKKEALVRGDSPQLRQLSRSRD